MKKTIVTLLLILWGISVAQAKPYLDIQEIETPKGLSVWFVQDETVPVLSLRFSVPAYGDERGVGNLLSTILDEGAGKRNSEAFQRDMDAHGISMGFSAGRDRFRGSMKTTTAHMELATELLADALNRPHYNYEAIKRMKQAIYSNMRFQAMDPNYMAGRQLHTALFGKQPYAFPVEGTEQTVRNISIADLKNYKQEKLGCGKRFHIAMTGAITAETAIQIADTIFGDLTHCPEEKTALDDKLIRYENKGETIRVDWNGAQSVVLMAQPGLARQNSDWWAARILDFSLGGGQFSSRLMEEVRVKRGLTYGVASYLAPYDRAPLWFVQAGVDPAKTDEAVELIKKTWADVAENGLTEAEINDAKNYLLGSLPLALTSSDRITGILLQLQDDDLPKNTLDMRAAEINAITPQDVARVAKQRLVANELTTLIVGPKIEPQPETPKEIENKE